MVVIIAPNIVWNTNNNWSTFSHIEDNAGLDRLSFSFFEPIKFISSQILMLGPLIFLLFVFGLGKNFINDFETRFLLIFSLTNF